MGEEVFIFLCAGEAAESFLRRQQVVKGVWNQVFFKHKVWIPVFVFDVHQRTASAKTTGQHLGTRGEALRMHYAATNIVIGVDRG
jgi:hypothetical protein